MSALLRLIGWLLAVALVVLPVVAVLNGWAGSQHWPLTKLRATGSFERVDEALLRETVLPYAQHGFFAVRLDAAQAAVSRLPWVEHAEVRKRWPDVLEVRVIEHRPFARWGDDRLLSEHGRLFPAADIEVPDGLPNLIGPDARVTDVVALYNQSRTQLAAIGMDVRTVELDARGSWTLGLARAGAAAADTHIVVGRNEARSRIDRFVRLMPQLLAQGTQRLARADLRYTNGFALSWVAIQAPEPEPGTSTEPPAQAGQAQQTADALPAPARITRHSICDTALQPRCSLLPLAVALKQPIPRIHQAATI